SFYRGLFLRSVGYSGALCGGKQLPGAFVYGYAKTARGTSHTVRFRGRSFAAVSGVGALFEVNAGHVGGRRAVANSGGDLSERLFAAVARREHAGDGGGGILAGEDVAARVEGELV